jgi:hypothetical protein
MSEATELDILADNVGISVLNVGTNSHVLSVLNGVSLWLKLTVHCDVTVDTNNTVVRERKFNVAM